MRPEGGLHSHSYNKNNKFIAFNNYPCNLKCSVNSLIQISDLETIKIGTLPFSSPLWAAWDGGKLMRNSTGTGVTVADATAGEAQEFSSPAALAAWLRSRSRPSESRLLDAAALSAGDLRGMLDGLRDQVAVLADMRALAQTDGDVFLARLHSMNPRTVTQDQGWRELLLQAVDWEPAAIGYVVALVDGYLVYLREQLVRLERIVALRHGPKRRWDEISLDMRQEVSGDFEKRQLNAAMARLRDGFARVPQEQTIQVKVHPGDVIRLLLGHHDFDLLVRHQGVSELLDIQEIQARRRYRRRYRMVAGRYLIGRDAAADLQIDKEYRDVSRRHLALNTSHEGQIEFTDLSSQGTFIDRKWLRLAETVRVASNN